MGSLLQGRSRQAKGSCDSKEYQYYSSTCFSIIARTRTILENLQSCLYVDFHSQSISSMDSRLKGEHQDLRSQILEHRRMLSEVQGRIGNVEETMREQAKTEEANHAAITSRIDTLQDSVLNLRTFGSQVLKHMCTFPQSLQSQLRAILYSNWQMYQVLLRLQQQVPQNPTSLMESNIRFEDALGDFKELPYEYFRHWEV